jgi:hypothetical protein
LFDARLDPWHPLMALDDAAIALAAATFDGGVRFGAVAEAFRRRVAPLD